MRLIFKSLWIVFLCGSTTSAYNIEDRLPLYKRGEFSSTFGFSVAMHKTTNKTQGIGSVEGSLLIIGGPTARALPSQPNTIRPGGIYSCLVSTNADDCSRINIDEGGSNKTENKTDQWLGVRIKSRGPGQELITCAHRFSSSKGIESDEKQQVCGKCFLLNGTRSNGIWNVSSDYEKKFLSSPCFGRNSYDKNKFAYTQAGTSIEFVEDEYFLGGPGSYAWSGGIYGYPMPEFLTEKNLNKDRKMFGSPGCFQNEFNQDTVKCQKIPLRRDSYIGFSMTTSNAMTYKREVTYIAGAPRGNFTGAVIMYKKRMTTENENMLELSVVEKDILMGEHMGSSFGYSLITTDLNNDGLDDLIVGSPQYYEEADDDNYGGAVYVYINKRKPRFNQNPVQKLTGNVGSFFGHSITRLGDIDQDGYNDFAVGAPFEGSGKVYIYRGSSDGKITRSQILDGKKFTGVTPNMKGFGLSLSGDVDIDNNKYPDLLVGTLKDQAILFRSRPVISVKSSFKLSTELIDLQTPGCRLHRKDFSCFYLQVCLEYTSKHSEYISALPLKYTISLDSKKPKERKHARVRFSSPTGLSIKTGNFSIPRSDFLFCLKNHTIYYLLNALDKLSPIDIFFGFSLASDEKKVVPEPKGDPIYRMIDDPILDKRYPSETIKTVKIKTDCGDDGCQSDLQISGSIPPELIAGTNEKVVMKLNVKNPGEEAHGALFSVKLPPNVFFHGYNVAKPSKANIICSSRSSRGSSTFVECKVGNPYLGGSSDQIEIYLDISSLNADFTNAIFEISGSTTSNNTNKLSLTLRSEIIGKMELTLSGYGQPQQVRYTDAPILGESAIQFREQIGPSIAHTFVVENKGKLTADKILLNIHYPYEINNGKWLLYLISTKVTVGADVLAGECSSQYTNPRKYTAAPPDMKLGRRRRDVKEGKTAPLYETKKTFQSGSPLSSLKLNCKDKTARCVTIQCTLEPLNQGRSVSIYIKSRLWNATFLEEFKKVDLVYVGVDANLSYNKTNIRIIGNQTKKEIQTTVDHVFFEEDISSTFPWWYILFAIFMALIIYALIICVLIRCGFFPKKRYHRKPSPENEELLEERRTNAEERM